MNPSRTIPTAPLEHAAMDYAFLRREGIRQLERLAGQLWTDFNAHDPGITILEQVCYAMTDLAYRIDHDLPDLLARGDEQADKLMISIRQSYLIGFPGCFVHNQQLFHILSKLRVGVQQLDAVDFSVRRHIDNQFITQVYRLDLPNLLPETNVGNIITRIVGEFHNHVLYCSKITCNNGYDKPVRIFSNCESLDLFYLIEAIVPFAFEGEISTESGSPVFSWSTFAEFDSLFNFIFGSAALFHALKRVWMKPDHGQSFPITFR